MTEKKPLCPEPAEALIQKADTLFYCPLDGVMALGWMDAEPGKVACNHDPKSCPAIRRILAQRAVSARDTNYKSHLPNNRKSADADDPDNVFFVKAVRHKR